MTSIQWTDETWNPLAGCSVISPGCTNCYAMRMAGTRLKNTDLYRGLTQPSKAGPVWTGEVRLNEKALELPLRWRKPRRIFVNSMSDLFHENVPTDSINRIFAIMEAARRHRFQVLTKRPGRMSTYMYTASGIVRKIGIDCLISRGYRAGHWPPPNIWLGTSVEDRDRKLRIDTLRNTPAAVRFISFEPLLEDIGELDLTGIHWAIVGGESGPKARLFDIEWARSIIAQCKAAGVACFVKQVGSKPFDSSATHIPVDVMMIRDHKGGTPEEWPVDLRVREWPESRAAL